MINVHNCLCTVCLTQQHCLRAQYEFTPLITLTTPAYFKNKYMQRSPCRRKDNDVYTSPQTVCAVTHGTAV